jgi:predicted transcriptional regulator
MITGPQIRAARALLGIDQKRLAKLSGLSTPTIQRMEACEGSVRAVVDSLEKVMTALAQAGVELIVEGAPSQGAGLGARLIEKR